MNSIWCARILFERAANYSNSPFSNFVRKNWKILLRFLNFSSHQELASKTFLSIIGWWNYAFSHNKTPRKNCSFDIRILSQFEYFLCSACYIYDIDYTVNLGEIITWSQKVDTLKYKITFWRQIDLHINKKIQECQNSRLNFSHVYKVNFL